MPLTVLRLVCLDCDYAGQFPTPTMLPFCCPECLSLDIEVTEYEFARG